MADTKGDNESTLGEVIVRDTDEEVDKDKADDKDEDDERNKVDDGDVEAQEKATTEEENAGTDETNDVGDEDNDDGDKNDEEGGRDEDKAAVEDEEVERDETGHHNQPEESAASDTEDNKEAELQEGEPSVHEDDLDADQEEAEENIEDTAEEGQEGKEEGEKEEAAEKEDQMTAEYLELDNTEQIGSRDLTEEDKTRCRLMFDRKAINGRLDLKGFKTVFRVLGEILASEEAERMFEAGDRDDDDTLDFDEFFRLYAKFRQEEQARREAILDSVDKLFLCGSGDTIELKKVQQLLLKLQQPDLDIRLVREKSDLGEDDVKQMIKSLDKKGNGFISKEEFVDIMCQHLEM